MKLYTKGEIEKILRRYDADYDLGPNCPVTWREERLAQGLLELQEELDELQNKVSRILDALPSAGIREI